MELEDRYFPVLDKGFIALKKVMGDDEDIEQAARVSYGKGTRRVSETRGLIRYLMRHRHTSPFEMCEMKFHVKVPMDCWRQWIRHRTANVNEYSTRYSEAINDKQCTDETQWRLQDKKNKQGSSGFVEKFPDGYIPLTASDDGNVRSTTAGEYLANEEERLHNFANKVYQERLMFGVAREQARKDLPLSTYTEAYWKIDLHNLLHFLSLRCDSHAQQEIRSYANVIAGMVKECFPLVFEAWYDYCFTAHNFTRLDIIVLREWIEQNRLSCEEYLEEFEDWVKTEVGMSKRELDEFWEKIAAPTQHDFALNLSDSYDYSHFEGVAS